MDRFTGWPKPALTFLQGLHRDNSKAYFADTRGVFETDSKERVRALYAEPEQQPGPGWGGR